MVIKRLSELKPKEKGRVVKVAGKGVQPGPTQGRGVQYTGGGYLGRAL